MYTQNNKLPCLVFTSSILSPWLNSEIVQNHRAVCQREVQLWLSAWLIVARSGRHRLAALSDLLLDLSTQQWALRCNCCINSEKNVPQQTHGERVKAWRPIRHITVILGTAFTGHDPTSCITALKEASWSSTSSVSPTRTTPPCYNDYNTSQPPL